MKKIYPSYRQKLVQKSEEDPIDIILIPEGEPTLSPETSPYGDTFILEKMMQFYDNIKDEHTLTQAEMITKWLLTYGWPWYTEGEMSLSVKSYVEELSVLYKNALRLAGATNPDMLEKAKALLGEEEMAVTIPEIPMTLTYGDEGFGFSPIPRSQIERAYFEMAQLATSGRVAKLAWQGMISPAFCESCGRLFYRNGPRQKYCERLECQAARTRKKNKTYYEKKTSLS